MRFSIALLLCVIAFSTCSPKTETVDLEKVKVDVTNADIAFSKFSQDSGYQKAFIEYADQNAIKLNPRQFASFGKQDQINQFEEEQAKASDTSISAMKPIPGVLSWKPLHVVVSNSGDMASAFGDWQLKTKLPNSKDTTFFGNYITIWKKQKDGGWKYILDGGNPTPGPTDEKLLDKLVNK